ncbi:MAG: ABC transporter ATP-binding protein [Firmicutes bacterium]|nr:ABC transporter ATP-binding protein [Bacillota bacterium]
MALLELRGLTKAFGGVTAVSDITFDVEEGQIAGLIGPNGAGKTTLFNLISAIYKPTRGQVNFAGRNLAVLTPDQVARSGIGRTFQVVKPFAGLTVLENVMVGAFMRSQHTSEARERAEEVLRFVDLFHKRNEPARSLTLPDRKRLELAKALATKPKLLLLDEVMAGLNPAEVSAALSLVRQVRDHGVTVLMIEHVMTAVMSLCEHIVVLNYGQYLAEGSPKEIANHPEVIRAYLGEGMAHA